MQLKKYKVYLLQNTQNPKVYVGYTGQKYVSSRFGKHRQEAKRGKDTHLYRAMRLYGSDSFYWNVIGDFDTKQEAATVEKIWIVLLQSKNPEFGYNTTDGGEAPQHSEETKQKIGRIQRENPKPHEFYEGLIALSKTPEARAKQSESLKAAWAAGAFDCVKGDNHWSRRVGLSIESRRKQSESLKKTFRENPERCGMRGKKHSEEAKIKIRAAEKGKKRGPMSEETKQKISANRKGKGLGPMKEETKTKLREAAWIRNQKDGG